MTVPTMPRIVAQARERAKRERSRVCATRDQLRFARRDRVVVVEYVIVAGES